MALVVIDVSVSLDGFMAGPNITEAVPMGDGGEQLHAWMAGDGPRGDVDRAAFAESYEDVGAAVVGRRTFEVGLRPWGGTPWPGVPTFVVTHRPREPLVGDNGGTFTFTSLEDAVRLARDAAGDAKVRVLGAEVGRGLMRAGLVDELWIQVVPLLLGGGARLFDGERLRLEPIGEPKHGSVTHLRFRVVPGGPG